MNHHHDENMPTWAHRVDSYGRSHWHKEKRFKSRRGEYIGAIIFNLVFLWVVNHLLGWHLGFIKDNFVVVLWILNVNILVQIGANVLMLMFDVPFVRRISIIISEAAGFITTLVLYVIYPFDFHAYPGWQWIDWFLPVIFIIGMIVSAIKILTNFWKLLFSW